MCHPYWKYECYRTHTDYSRFTIEQMIQQYVEDLGYLGFRGTRDESEYILLYDSRDKSGVVIELAWYPTDRRYAHSVRRYRKMPAYWVDRILRQIEKNNQEGTAW